VWTKNKAERGPSRNLSSNCSRVISALKLSIPFRSYHLFHVTQRHVMCLCVFFPYVFAKVTTSVHDIRVPIAMRERVYNRDGPSILREIDDAYEMIL
jgi:hypothetical protein